MLNKLTPAVIRQLPTSSRSYKKFDGGGLYIDVAKSGQKFFRQKYHIGGKTRVISHGVFPDDVTAQARALKAARNARDDAKRLLRSGIDPMDHRNAAKKAHVEAGQNTFQFVALEWLETQTHAPSYGPKIKRRLETYVFPVIGSKSVASITPKQVLEMLKKVEAHGHHETARRIRTICSAIFVYASVTERATANPCVQLGRYLTKPQSQKMAAILSPTKLGTLLRDIDAYQGSPVVRAALKLAPLLCVRPGELRSAEWKDIDFDRSLWTIPAARMKSRVEHEVPLAPQAIAILKGLQPITGQGRYVFPGARSIHKPMSENAVNAAMRYMGHEKSEVTGHGFRATMSTLINESGLFREDVIERQLAHRDPNRIRRAYDRSEHFEERRRLMIYYADLLDQLREDANPLKNSPLESS